MQRKIVRVERIELDWSGHHIRLFGMPRFNITLYHLECKHFYEVFDKWDIFSVGQEIDCHHCEAKLEAKKNPTSQDQ